MKTVVLGLGNVLMGDDALGPHVAHALDAAWEFPDGVSVLDAGTPGLDLTPFITGIDSLIIVDTVSSDGAPGELRFYRRDEILRYPPQPRLSPHDPGLKEALLTAEFAGIGPREVLLVGVIPGSVRMGVGMTEAVAKAVPAACEAVIEELVRLGVPPVRKQDPHPAIAWWEAT